MLRLPTPRVANATGAIACALFIGYALYAQYGLGLDPCPLCTFQRIAFIALGVVFLVAAIHNPKSYGARVYAIVLVIVALLGIAIAAKHLWIQAQPPGSVGACGASLSYLLDIMSVFEVIKKVLTGSGECQHVDLFLGLSWPWWTVIAMTGLGVWGVATNWVRSNRNALR